MPPHLVFYTLSHSSDTVYKESSTVSNRFILTNQNVKQIKFIISAYIKCMIGEFFQQVFEVFTLQQFSQIEPTKTNKNTVYSLMTS